MTKQKYVAVASATALVIATTFVASPAANAAQDITVNWSVSDSWSTGATVDATITNHSTTPLNPWRVSFIGGPQVSSVWNATAGPGGAINAPAWAATLAPGASATFGMSVSNPNAPTGCTVAGHECQVISADPAPTPTQTSSPSPTQTAQPSPTSTSPSPVDNGAAGLPTPVRFTPKSTASGTINYHLNLPYGSGNVEKLQLSANYTDLITSNYVAGVLLGRMLHEKDPGLVFNKDYVYGSVFAQLLQENINTGGYTQTTDWINSDPGQRNQLLASGQGGPYQINDYSKRLETSEGVGLVNFTALQKALGYTVEDQDSGHQTASVGPDSLDQKYFGPLAAAYFHLNDYNRMEMNNKDSWGPQRQYYEACMTNLRQPSANKLEKNMYDLLLNAAYNAGTYSAILKDYFRVCAGMNGTGVEATQVKSLADYTLSDAAYKSAIGTSESAGSTFILYPRQIRLYLDQMYNQKTFDSAAIDGKTSINLSVEDIGHVFANSMGTLAYVDSGSKYGYVAPAESSAAFTAAATKHGLTSASFVNISTPTGKAAFFGLLEDAIANLANNLGIDFSAVTQTTIGATTPTASASPSASPTQSASPSASPTSPTPTATSPTGQPGLRLAFENVSDWGSGRTMNATIQNQTATSAQGWTITFDWPQDFTPWNADRVSYKNGKITLKNASWNASLAAGVSTSFGFSDGSAQQPKPTSCTATLGGVAVPCTVS